jgi:tetratricopeptide (TPR) repeat protein
MMESLPAQLAQLENAQLVRRLADEDLAYDFKHTLTQETAYESLLVKKRRAIHRFVAQAYEQLYAERLDEFATRLAHHYSEVGDDAKTLEYATRAGNQAARVYAHAEALAYYTQALALAQRGSDNPAQLIQLFSKRGRIFELMGNYEQALANYDDMETLAHVRGDRSLELESLMLRAIIHSTPTKVFDPVQAQPLTDRALALARDLGNSAAEAKVLWILGLLNWFAARTPEAVEYGEQSLALARQFDLREQLAFTLNNLSYPYMSSGRTEQAVAVAAEARDLWRELDNQPMLADSLATLAWHESARGEFDRVLEYGDQALRLSQDIGSLWGQSFSQNLTGHVFWERGEPDRAIQIMSECIRLAEQAGFGVPQFGTRADLGWVYASLGAVESGLELVRVALRSADVPHLFGSWPFATLARIQLLAGHVTAAEEAVKHAHANTRPDYLGNLPPAISSGFAFAEIELALAQHEHARAAALADQLIHFLEGARLRAGLPEAHYLKAQALLRQGEREPTRAELVEARAAAEAIGSRRMLWQILFELSQFEAQRGESATAQTLRSQAREIVAYLADHTPPELRAVFLKLPKILVLMEE